MFSLFFSRLYRLSTLPYLCMHLFRAGWAAHVSNTSTFEDVPSGFPLLNPAYVARCLGSKAIVILTCGLACSGAKAFAMDTRSKRRWECPALKRTTAAAFRSACNAFGFSAAQILPHGETALKRKHHNADQLRRSSSDSTPKAGQPLAHPVQGFPPSNHMMKNQGRTGQQLHSAGFRLLTV